MAFYEIDFLPVETKKSGDAIAIRYSMDGTEEEIHVVDGGFLDTGEKLVEHIDNYFSSPSVIDRVILTHPDGDHAAGLRTVLETFEVRELWMLRPWDYVDELLPRFKRYTTAEGLAKRLKEAYPNVHKLDEIAKEKGIPTYSPFVGAVVGAFTVLAPSKQRYLDLLVESEKTPDEKDQSRAAFESLGSIFKTFVNYVRAGWGEEKFSPDPTSNENEMSVIQYSCLCDQKILLTGDAGREGLEEAANNTWMVGLSLPGIDTFQVPHHGSRRNVSSEILDRWLGPKLSSPPQEGGELFTAVVSSAKEDEKHPRNSVVRAFHHRGAVVLKTEGKAISISKNAPKRDGWVTATREPYPETHEEN